MAADVTDSTRVEFPICQCEPHRGFHSVRSRLGYVPGIAIRAETDDLRDNARTSSFGKLEILENEACDAFADHESVPVPVERPWR